MSKPQKKKKPSSTKSSIQRPALGCESRGGKSSAQSLCAQISEGLIIRHPKAAGIDIGSRDHWVSVGGGPDTVRRFASHTLALEAMVDWLRECGIEDVAMESTGVYWVAAFERLAEAGFRVILVDARQTKHTAGRKSDLHDCQWIQQLHSYGLLRAAFRPAEEVCRLRTLQRHRKSLVEMATTHLLHVQKALDGMNLHVHHALSDISGQSGQAMITAILAGERNPKALARLADRRVKKSQQELEASLTGHYRETELFVLAQAQESYLHTQKQIARCDQQIETQIAQMSLQSPERAQEEEAAVAPSTQDAPPAEGKKKARRVLSKRAQTKRQEANMAAHLRSILGVDLTAIPGLGVLAVLTLLSEIGSDMSKWRHAKAFASWLGLCPNHRISGGRILSSRSRKVVNRAATILRMAALVVGKTETPLGCFFRRKRAQLGAPKAITATAHKIACLVYEMVSTQTEYRQIDASAYQQKYDQQSLESLRKRAHKLGYEIVELQAAA
jgi:transposase